METNSQTIKIIDEIKHRQCSGEDSCGEWLPAELEFFQSNGHGGMDRLCKVCRADYRQKTRKYCGGEHGCLKTKPISEFDEYQLTHQKKNGEVSVYTYRRKLCRPCQNAYVQGKHKDRVSKPELKTEPDLAMMISVRGQPEDARFEPPAIPWPPSIKKDGIYGLFGGTPTLKQVAKQADLNPPSKAQVVSIRSVAA